MLSSARRAASRLGVAIALIASATVPGVALRGVMTTAATAPGAGQEMAVQYSAPLPGPLRVVTPFRAPATRFGPGHRGVDLAAAQGSDVHAAATGEVVFAGRVAGRGVIVLRHANGTSTEYEPIHPLVAVGTTVARGTVMGTVEGQHGSCPGASCLHWGARRDGTYVDPLDLLRPLGPVRLIAPG